MEQGCVGNMENLDFTEYNAAALFGLRSQGVAARARNGLVRMRERALRSRELTLGSVSQKINRRSPVRQAFDRRVGDVPSLAARLRSLISTIGNALQFLWRRIASPRAIANSGKDNEKMKSRGSAASRPAPGRSPEDSLVEHYEKQLQELRRLIETEKWEKTIIEAWESRELMATLREEEWLGLRLLAHLRSSPMAAHELVSVSQVDLDCVVAAVARLFRFGAADLQDRLFTCTDKGRDILQNIESNARVELTPQSELATMRG